MKHIPITIALVSSLIACNAQTEQVEKEEIRTDQSHIKNEESIQVYVDKKGQITLNGNRVSLTELEEALILLKSKNGVVHYSRANVSNDPPRESMQVLELVVKYELPIKFFTDKTFNTPANI